MKAGLNPKIIWRGPLPIGLPEPKWPVLVMKTSVSPSEEPSQFLEPASAAENLGEKAPVIILHPYAATAGVVAHESLHYAQWSVRQYGARRVLRWLGIDPDQYSNQDRWALKDEAEAYLMEQVMYRICEQVLIVLDLTLKPFSILQAKNLTMNFNIGDHHVDPIIFSDAAVGAV